MGNLSSSARRSSTTALLAMSLVLKDEEGASCAQSGSEPVRDALAWMKP